MGGEQAAVVMTVVGQAEVGAQPRERYQEQDLPVYSTARICVGRSIAGVRVAFVRQGRFGAG
jgi:hypothetical protein